MELVEKLDGKHLTVLLKGEFADTDYELFSGIQHHFNDLNISHITFDLSELTFIDSSALGMFLIARERAQNHGNMFMDIINVTGQPRRALEIAKFDMIMNFS